MAFSNLLKSAQRFAESGKDVRIRPGVCLSCTRSAVLLFFVMTKNQAQIAERPRKAGVLGNISEALFGPVSKLSIHLGQQFLKPSRYRGIDVALRNLKWVDHERRTA